MRRVLAPIAVPALCRLAGLRLGDELRRLRRESTQSVAEIEAVQEARFRLLVGEVIRRVPFYRDRFASAGITGAIGRSELHRLPLLTKADVRDAFPERIVAEASGPLYEKTTSGSEGMPLRMVVDRDQRSVQMARTEFAYEWSGSGRGRRVVVVATRNGDRSRVRRMYEWCKGETRLALPSLDRRGIAALHDDLVAARPHLLQMGVTPLLALVDHIERSGRQDLRPTVVHAIAEPLFPAERARIERALEARVLSVYGSNEIYGIGIECVAGSRVHLLAPDVIVEVVDERGRSVPAGETGRLVLTDLHNRVMPFIRYAIGDVGALAAAPCSCGSPLPTLELIEGRVADRLVTPAGKVLSAPQFSALASRYRWIRRFQVAQLNAARFEMRLEVESDPDDSAWRQVRDEATTLFDESVRVDLVPDALPAPASGKRRVFVRELDGASSSVGRP